MQGDAALNVQNRRPHSWTKPSYFCIRHITLLDLAYVYSVFHIICAEIQPCNDRAKLYMNFPGHSASVCSRWDIWELVFLVILKMQVDTMLMMRGMGVPLTSSSIVLAHIHLSVHALYHKNRVVLLVIIALFAMEYLMPIINGALTITKMTFVGESCVVAVAPPLFMACWCVLPLHLSPLCSHLLTGYQRSSLRPFSSVSHSPRCEKGYEAVTPDAPSWTLSCEMEPGHLFSSSVSTEFFVDGILLNIDGCT